MRSLRVLLSTLALAFVCASALAAAPVRVSTNPEYGGILLGGVLLYPGSSGPQGLELWRTDGTPAGTVLVKDLRPGVASSYPSNFALAGGVAYLTAHVTDNTYALWTSDGTAGGTTKVADLPGVPVLLQAVGTAVFFNVDEFGTWAVWRSDGTPGGTQRIIGGFSYVADEFTAAAGKVFFSVDDGVSGEELWMTDGSFEGTGLVRDINPGSNDGLALGLRAVNGQLLFGALNLSGGLGLWRSDGTEAGTQPVGIPPITGDMGPVIGNAVLLTASDDAGSELWRSDGTVAGSFRVSDLLPGASSRPRDFVDHLGVAYFSASYASGGQTTLFRSDGTAAGTARMTALLPSGASLLNVIGGAGEEIFYLVQEGQTTRAIWGADRNLRIARKRFQLTSPGDVYIWFHVTPSGLYFSVERSIETGFASELWFVAAESPAGDDDVDGVPNGVEPGEGLNLQAKDNDVFTSARLFAMQQYRDFLGREGDVNGIVFHTQNINSGASPRVSVIENFLASPEFQNGLPQCTRLYFSFFNRIPDYGGLQFQVGQFRSGVPLDVISQNFSNSPEFTNRYGALTNEQYVDLVYQNVLGRAPDPGGRQFYLERLADGRLTRGQMMIGFSESPEFQQIVLNEVYVTAVYVGMLRRAPDPGGMDFYVNQIEGGAPRNSIINGFMGSPEYRARFLP